MTEHHANELAHKDLMISELKAALNASEKPTQYSEAQILARADEMGKFLQQTFFKDLQIFALQLASPTTMLSLTKTSLWHVLRKKLKAILSRIRLWSLST